MDDGVVRFGESADGWPDRPDMTLPAEPEPAVDLNTAPAEPEPAPDPVDDEEHVEVPGMELADFDSRADRREVAAASKTRLEAAFALKLAGATWEDIARVQEFRSAAAARLAVEKVLASTVKDDDSDAKAVRKWSNLRLEAMMKSLAGNALAPTVEVKDPKDAAKKIRVPNELHLPYLREMLKVVDRHARLNGADAPQTLQFITPSVEDFEKTIALMASAANGEGPVEADIFADSDVEMELVDGAWTLIQHVDEEEQDAS